MREGVSEHVREGVREHVREEESEREREHLPQFVFILSLRAYVSELVLYIEHLPTLPLSSLPLSLSPSLCLSPSLSLARFCLRISSLSLFIYNVVFLSLSFFLYLSLSSSYFSILSLSRSPSPLSPSLPLRAK